LALSSAPIRVLHLHGREIREIVPETGTDKKARIYDGYVATIIGIETSRGQVQTILDSGCAVSWSAAEFPDFLHRYVGMIYKGRQGKTLDHAYLYHTEHSRSAASCVALTRQRESAR
jgi:hypothetical protein